MGKTGSGAGCATLRRPAARVPCWHRDRRGLAQVEQYTQHQQYGQPGAAMATADPDLQFREQIFFAGVCLFLLCFAISLYRYRSLAWASITSTAALVVVMLAGGLLTQF